MKIVQINTVFDYGSTGRIVKNIHFGIKAKGYQSYIFYGRGPKVTEKNIIKFGNKLELFLDVFLTRFFNRHGEANFFSTLNLIRKLKRINPDIIHLHNIHGYYLNYAMLFRYLRKTKIPVLWLQHDRWAISGSSAFFDPEKLDWDAPMREDLKVISKYYPKYIFFDKKSAIRNYLRKKTIFNLPNLYLISPSEWQKKIFSKSFFEMNEIKVINNGVNLELFKPIRMKKRSQKKILLGVANKWDYNKGLSTFNRLAEDLDSSYRIILVGLDSENPNFVNPRIECIKRTDTIPDLVKYYSKADVFINPTLDDNFPTVNIESQACGTPVITFDTGGSGESIKEGTGVIVEKGNYDELLKQIILWPHKNSLITQNCIDNAENYGINNMVDKYISLYHTIKLNKKMN